MDKKYIFLIILFSINLFSQPIPEVNKIQEIPEFQFTTDHLKTCQNLINQSKKGGIPDSEFWKEFNSDKCLPKNKIIHMKDVCFLELVGSKDEVAFFFDLICSENNTKKIQKKMTLIPIMTVAESDPSDLREFEYTLDEEYKNFRTKYQIGTELLKYKKHSKFDAEILQFDRDGDLMFYTIINLKPRK
ncbi:hypothetical protein EHQ31_16110 [Leptospira montravelensis]|uniref:Uncharacterized protein n=1 Tax=Leptospira montravelensis TaxID=2484961 RepID=A0ABY2LMD4_9LEPT|nr:hypothetical protein [Leptospira montravelensis]TGK80158.1 hypothetical protein EHQ19_10685 [Leptospira montravelensis]TGL00328.1 hypothetical protein EHQ31_16110 [Leptospira montravelensis]